VPVRASATAGNFAHPQSGEFSESGFLMYLLPLQFHSVAEAVKRHFIEYRLLPYPYNPTVIKLNASIRRRVLPEPQVSLWLVLCDGQCSTKRV
jgi:hypothetical protein